MPPRHVVATVGLLFTILALAPRGAHASVGAFALSAPANGAFATALPTLKWGASAGATSYTLTVTPSSGAPLVKSALATTAYTIAAGETLSEAGSPYTWRVTARDDGGNTLDSSSASFFVDTTPPTDFGLLAPADGAFSQTYSARFSWDAASDAGSGLSKYHFYIDGALCGDALTAGFAFLPSSCNPADGMHTWSASAEDLVGNVKWCREAPGGVGGRAIKIDNTAPSAGNGGGVFQIASANTPDQYGFPVDHMVNTGINVTPGDQISVTSTGMWCFLGCTSGCYDTAGYNNPVNTPTQSCNNSSLIARVGGGTSFKCIGKSATFTAGPNDSGILELGSNAQIGCTDKTVTATVTGGRLFSLVSPAADAILGQQSPTFSWQAAADQGSSGVTYLLYIDGIAVGSTTTSIGTVINGTSFTITTRLTDGAHTWYVIARDAAGNVTSSTTRTFTVDTTRPPEFRLRMPAAGACAMTPTPSLCWNAVSDPGGVAGYQLWVDGAQVFTTSSATTTCGTPAAALAPGVHTWYAVAIDRTGNTRQSLETFSILIDYTAPAAPALLAPANGSSSADPPMFAWSAAADAGGVAKYEVYVDGALAATVTGKTLGWLPTADLRAGSHTWYVRAIDACNQATSSAMGSFTTVACTPDGASHPCPGHNVGVCMPGTRTCTGPGTWSACTGVVDPSSETCNKLDDDCNGVIDDGTNSCGGVCTLPVYLYTPCDGPDSDLCQEGVYMCSGLNSLTCVETTPVNVEVCNGRDDDCNNVIDDPPVCTGGPPPDGGTQPDSGAPSDGGAGGARGTGGGAGNTDAAMGMDAVAGTGGAGVGGGIDSGGQGSGGVADGGQSGPGAGGQSGASAMDAAQTGAGGTTGIDGGPGTVPGDSGVDMIGGVTGTSASGCSCATASGRRGDTGHAGHTVEGSSLLTMLVGLALVGGRRRARRRASPVQPSRRPVQPDR